MDEPDDAFCPLLWQSRGGQLNAKGKPIFERDNPINGRCHEPGDCDTHCEIMKGALANLTAQGVLWLWICPACVGSIHQTAEDKGVQIRLPGFFKEGLCGRPLCHRGEPGSEDRYSPILQLLTVFGTEIP